MIALSGVRSSCDMFARNFDLNSLSRSACSLARSICLLVRASSWFFNSKSPRSFARVSESARAASASRASIRFRTSSSRMCRFSSSKRRRRSCARSRALSTSRLADLTM